MQKNPAAMSSGHSCDVYSYLRNMGVGRVKSVIGQGVVFHWKNQQDPIGAAASPTAGTAVVRGPRATPTRSNQQDFVPASCHGHAAAAASAPLKAVAAASSVAIAPSTSLAARGRLSSPSHKDLYLVAGGHVEADLREGTASSFGI